MKPWEKWVAAVAIGFAALFFAASMAWILIAGDGPRAAGYVLLLATDRDARRSFVWPHRSHPIIFAIAVVFYLLAMAGSLYLMRRRQQARRGFAVNHEESK